MLKQEYTPVPESPSRNAENYVTLGHLAASPDIAHQEQFRQAQADNRDIAGQIQADRPHRLAVMQEFDNAPSTHGHPLNWSGKPPHQL